MGAWAGSSSFFIVSGENLGRGEPGGAAAAAGAGEPVGTQAGVGLGTGGVNSTSPLLRS